MRFQHAPCLQDVPKLDRVTEFRAVTAFGECDPARQFLHSEGVDWNANPFDRAAQTGTITVPVVKAGGAVLMLDEDK